MQVVRSRNSASIYRPTCVANLVNAALWVAYGIVSMPSYLPPTFADTHQHCSCCTANHHVAAT